MRKSTLMVTSLFAASALTVAWNAGQLTTNNEILLSPAESTSNPAPTEVAATDPNATSTATAEPTATASAPATSPAPGQTAAPAPSPTATAAPTTPAAPVTVTANSDPITYKYGTVQISMTSVDGAITNIKMLQGDATNGRDSAYKTLIDATIQNQGTNYGNISGATFTVDAFKKAVDSALLKF